MKEIRLGDYIDLLTDYHSGGSYKILKENTKILHDPNYAVMLRTLNFERNEFTNELIYCDKKSYDFLDYSHLKENDVLMNKIANPGSVYIMPKVDYKATCAMNLFLLRFKNINQRYLYYVMKYHEDYIKSKAHGTTTKTITKEEVRDLVFMVHDTIDEQNKIEKLLSSIETKIALNNKTNAELENMAKTVYDYWFTQFDFPDKNGTPYKTSGGQMVYNETLKRDIPAGWEVKNIFNCADVLYGFPFSTEPFDEDIVNSTKPYKVIRIRDIQDNSFSAKTDEEVSSNYKTKIGDLLIGMDGNFHMNFWNREGDFVNQRIVRVREVDISTMLIYFQIKPYIKARETNVARSTVGHLSDKDMKSMNILIPSDKRINEYFNMVLNNICKNRNENEELARLRDYLLPLLMNGQIEVK